MRRLDAELVRRGLARSREDARELVESGAVTVRGSVASKAATQVDPADAIVVAVPEARYVSRGAHKLIGALDAFPEVAVAGRDCLDAGASTGGFTQVLLERGAARVICVDVGYGQLAWPVRTDPRVVVMERTNVRHLQPTDLEFAPQLVVSDLSFISLAVVLPALVRCSDPSADLVLMVKPQFEVGRTAVADGVVRDPALRASSVLGVGAAAQAEGLAVRGVAASPLPGPRGNVEYFLWLTAAGGRMDPDAALTGGSLESAVARAVKEGPQ